MVETDAGGVRPDDRFRAQERATKEGASSSPSRAAAGTQVSTRNVTDPIYLPAGTAKFNWTDVADIGRAIATVLKAPRNYANKVYVITGREQLAFAEVAELITRITAKPVRFKSPTLLAFFMRKQSDLLRNSRICSGSMRISV